MVIKGIVKLSLRDIPATMENRKEYYQYLSLNNFSEMKIGLAKWASDQCFVLAQCLSHTLTLLSHSGRNEHVRLVILGLAQMTETSASYIVVCTTTMLDSDTASATVCKACMHGLW